MDDCSLSSSPCRSQMTYTEEQLSWQSSTMTSMGCPFRPSMRHCCCSATFVGLLYHVWFPRVYVRLVTRTQADTALSEPVSSRNQNNGIDRTSRRIEVLDGRRQGKGFPRSPIDEQSSGGCQDVSEI